MSQASPLRKTGYAGSGIRIRQARKKAKLSQAELARRLEVTPGAVGQWEAGLTRPGQDKLVALSAVLNLSVAELLGLPKANRKMAALGRAVSEGLELDRRLLDQARGLGIDIALALNRHLRELVGKARAEQWLKENRAALDDANAFLARHGLWSDGKRQF
jgi:antitoxin CcdA